MAYYSHSNPVDMPGAGGLTAYRAFAQSLSQAFPYHDTQTTTTSSVRSTAWGNDRSADVMGSEFFPNGGSTRPNHPSQSGFYGTVGQGFGGVGKITGAVPGEDP